MVCEVVRKSVRFFPRNVCFRFGLAVGATKSEVICHAYAESRHTNSSIQGYFNWDKPTSQIGIFNWVYD